MIACAIRKNVFMESTVIKYKIHYFGYLGYKWKDREVCLAISKEQTLLFGLEKPKTWQKEMNHFSFLWLVFTPDASSKYGHWHTPVLRKFANYYTVFFTLLCEAVCHAH